MLTQLLVYALLLFLIYNLLEVYERVAQQLWRKGKKGFSKRANFLFACAYTSGYACQVAHGGHGVHGFQWYIAGIGLWMLATAVAFVGVALFHWALFHTSKPIFQLVMNTFVEKMDIVKDGELCLRRWYLTPRFNWSKELLEMFSPETQALLQSRYFLHWIVRSDDDRDPHDHPWSFKSRILAGMYIERVWFPCEEGTPYEVAHDSRYYPIAGQRYYCRQAMPGTVLNNHWTHTHMVQIIEPVYSLVLAGPHVGGSDDWGFWKIHPTDPTQDIWVHKKDYLATGDELRS